MIIYTNAPKEYDWVRWTTELHNHVATDRNDHPIRRVSIEETHAEAQRMRYGSGLFFSLEQTQFDEELTRRHGLVRGRVI
jgi:hypothetical protein